MEWVALPGRLSCPFQPTSSWRNPGYPISCSEVKGVPALALTAEHIDGDGKFGFFFYLSHSMYHLTNLITSLGAFWSAAMDVSGALLTL